MKYASQYTGETEANKVIDTNVAWEDRLKSQSDSKNFILMRLGLQVSEGQWIKIKKSKVHI